MRLNPYQKFQLFLAMLMVCLFLDLWITLQTGYTLAPELKAMFAILWSIILLLTDPKELAQLITSASASLLKPPPDGAEIEEPPSPDLEVKN
jgi:hypothetical protein